LDPGQIVAALKFQVDGYAITGVIGNTSEGPPVLGNLAYYVTYLVDTGLGPAVTVLVAFGALTSLRRHGRFDALLLTFPAVYLVIASLPLIRFERNLIVALPFLAILGGMGAVAIGELLGRAAERHDPTRTWTTIATAGVVVVAVILSAPITVGTVSSLREVDTRTAALGWVRANLPKGAKVARERFTPQLVEPGHMSDVGNDLIDRPLGWYRAKGYQYLIASDLAYGRYFRGDFAAQQSQYEAIFALPEVFTVSPGNDLVGPTIRIFRLFPDEARLSGDKLAT
jgi:hypothetical protein